MKEKITIGLFMDSFFPMIDGVAVVMDNYAKRLIKYANVIVFVPKIPGQKYDDSLFPYKVVRCKSLNLPVVDYSMPTPKLDRKFIKELKQYDLDMIHIHSPFMMGELGVQYAKKNKIPVIGTMHSQFKQDFKRAVKVNKVANILNHKIIRVFNKCDECWAVNSEVARIFHEEYGYKEMPRVMNNATDMKMVENKDKACEIINKKHNIKPDEKVFLFVGRINNLKNIFFIVESLKVVKTLKPDLKFKMIFVGNGQDEEELKKVVKNNGLEQEVIMTGKVTDKELLADYYARADLFLFPSLYDASSIVQIEAASQKTPTLFLEGAATTATITNNVNGFLSKNDKVQYANNIIRIMEDTDLYNQVSENCYKDLYKNWDDNIQEVYDLYVKTIENYKK